jgi:hypothetical protein
VGVLVGGAVGVEVAGLAVAGAAVAVCPGAGEAVGAGVAPGCPGLAVAGGAAVAVCPGAGEAVGAEVAPGLAGLVAAVLGAAVGDVAEAPGDGCAGVPCDVCPCAAEAATGRTPSDPPPPLQPASVIPMLNKTIHAMGRAAGGAGNFIDERSLSEGVYIRSVGALGFT